MSTPKFVYVVVVANTEFHYDDQLASYLPQLRPILGVFEDFNSAHGKVYCTFNESSSEKYEELKVDGDTYQYKYEDETYGGYAIYTVQVCKQHIEYRNSITSTMRTKEHHLDSTTNLESSQEKTEEEQKNLPEDFSYIPRNESTIGFPKHPKPITEEEYYEIRRCIINHKEGTVTFK